MRLNKKTLITILFSSIITLPAIADTKSMIPYTSEKDATGEVKEIYSQVKGAFGMIPAPIMQHSVSPDLLKNHWDYFGAISKNKNFSPKFSAIMRMSIASLDKFEHCSYCVDGNAMMLKHMFKMSDQEIQHLQKKPLDAKLNAKEKKMLAFLLQAAKSPGSLSKSDYDALRKSGWADKDIFEGLKMATQMIAAIYMVNALKIPSNFN
jgi:uncharacterized peroxidase-related enzyme